MRGYLHTAPRIISLSPLPLATSLSLVTRYTRGKWPLARNLENSWWYRHTSLKLFLAAVPMGPWTIGRGCPELPLQIRNYPNSSRSHLLVKNLSLPEIEYLSRPKSSKQYALNRVVTGPELTYCQIIISVQDVPYRYTLMNCRNKSTKYI